MRPFLNNLPTLALTLGLSGGLQGCPKHGVEDSILGNPSPLIRGAITNCLSGDQVAQFSGPNTFTVTVRKCEGDRSGTVVNCSHAVVQSFSPTTLNYGQVDCIKNGLGFVCQNGVHTSQRVGFDGQKWYEVSGCDSISQN